MGSRFSPSKAAWSDAMGAAKVPPRCGDDGLRSIAPLRCAIYTRKSTEEGLNQDFNTLEAQREAAEAYIRSQLHAGWIALAERYDDGGYTGANLERPALRRLLADIAAGRIDCVKGYKVRRLRRSLLDLPRLIEIFDARPVHMLSIPLPPN